MHELRCQTCGGLLAADVVCADGTWTIRCLKCWRVWRFVITAGVLTTTGCTDTGQTGGKGHAGQGRRGNNRGSG